jgi:hypothetical protein
MTFDEFVAPIGEERFLADFYGRSPVHLRAIAAGRGLDFGWDDLNALFAIAAHWTPGNIKLLMNSQPVDPAHYIDEVPTFDGPVRRADPAKMDLFLGMGASLVANAADAASPAIAAVTAMLSRRFTALASANIYCSFDGVQAFATHYDTHEVFALQCEGEKTWRLYANREVDPVDHPPHTPDAQARIDAARGPVVHQVTTRPGDLLYIPRGQYHDALAQQGASMHISFAVAPRTGRVLASLLDAAIGADPAFRAYLPDPDAQGGAALAARLRDLAGRLAGIVASPGFAIEVANAQRKAALARVPITLPERTAAAYLARTGRPAEVRRTATGARLIVAGREHPLGAAPDAADWALARPAFSDRELDARFAHVPEQDRRALIVLLLREGLVERYTPDL